jgi:hypothetical protein
MPSPPDNAKISNLPKDNINKDIKEKQKQQINNDENKIINNKENLNKEKNIISNNPQIKSEEKKNVNINQTKT